MSLANNLKKMSANTLTSFIAEKLNERRDDLVGKLGIGLVFCIVSQ